MFDAKRRIALISCSALLFAGSARAGDPSPADCSIPCGLNLVGTTGGVPDAHGQFSIIVNQGPNSPVPFSIVKINFDGCAPDIRLDSVQPFLGGGVVTANCGSGPVGEITATADMNGVAVFRVTGGARYGESGAGFKCAEVSATDGAGGAFVHLANVNVGAFDENGVGGVNVVDISLWLKDSFMSYVGRSDYNCTHTITPPDLSALLQVSLDSGSTISAAFYCH